MTKKALGDVRISSSPSPRIYRRHLSERYSSYRPIFNLTWKTSSWFGYLLWGDIIDHINIRVERSRQGKQCSYTWKGKKVENLKTMRRDQYIPRPESKSGTIDTRIRINKWTVFCHSGQFWGSNGESVGCGQRIFVPSFVNFSLEAIFSPNSLRASLFSDENASTLVWSH